MNIREAKEEIRHTLQAYLLKDAEGKYRFPTVRQRPILLMGPPGIGKTAILQQAAEECHVGLVAYTLTHHTRQSAVGLPHIEKRLFDGEEISVTEYTMSEIIASVYSYMERTGKREGILFLDEVNCVSETLAPTMLELLQNKTFGGHRVPDGWILVTAGNPPEYNRSVREFDVATLDRVRSIPVEPDCNVWLDYARERQVHPAILAYLAIHPEHFYLVEDRPEGKFFVTARGWEDLSELLKSYEELDLPVTEAVIGQYLQKQEAAKDFCTYYRLYRKYEEDYEIPALLNGMLREETRKRKLEMAKAADFEERFTVVNLLTEALSMGFSDWRLRRTWLQALWEALERLKRNYGEGPKEQAVSMEKSLRIRMDAGLLPEDQIAVEKWVIHQLEVMDLQLKKEHIHGKNLEFERLRQLYAAYVADLQDRSDQMSSRLQQAFQFCEAAFDQGQEMTLLLTELTRDLCAMEFIADHGSEEFLKFSDALMYRDRENMLREQCRKLMD